jgi:hypothetical protein
MATRVHLNKKNKFIKKKIKILIFFKKNSKKIQKKKKAERVAGPPLWGWPGSPQPQGVAFRPPPATCGCLGVARGHPLWLEGGPAALSAFFFFFKKKISIFIYFLINLYFFIKMDTWHLTESVKNFNRI